MKLIDGKPQWSERGADSWNPFNSGAKKISFTITASGGTGNPASQSTTCVYEKQDDVWKLTSGSTSTGLYAYAGQKLWNYASANISNFKVE